MANQIRPLARLFRAMADLIDQDHTSQTRYGAIAKAAGVVAARATAEELVAGRLWQVDGADLLASAYAFHAGLPRQAITAAHVQAMQQPTPGPGLLAPNAGPPWSTRPGLVGHRWATRTIGRRGRVPQRAPSRRPWIHISCPVLALASSTRPMWPSCGRWCRTCLAASSPHEASSSD
jgi:hypothetical protein